MARMTSQQQKAVADFRTQQQAAAAKRVEATKSLETLTESQATLRTSKQQVQTKLTEARDAAVEADRRGEGAARGAGAQEGGRGQAQGRGAGPAAGRGGSKARRRPPKERRPAQERGRAPAPVPARRPAARAPTAATPRRPRRSWPSRAPRSASRTSGGDGPDSYDCSGLTQAAWKEAGVDLPRTTWDQVEVGTRVATADCQPGDLVFFYDDISHVGIYMGDGMMIHAPKPGANVREESIYYMPIYGSVRPA